MALFKLFKLRTHNLRTHNFGLLNKLRKMGAGSSSESSSEEETYANDDRLMDRGSYAAKRVKHLRKAHEELMEEFENQRSDLFECDSLLSQERFKVEKLKDKLGTKLDQFEEAMSKIQLLVRGLHSLRVAIRHMLTPYSVSTVNGGAIMSKSTLLAIGQIGAKLEEVEEEATDYSVKQSDNAWKAEDWRDWRK